MGAPRERRAPGLRSLRRLPAHCTVAVTLCFLNRALSSSSDSSRHRAPSPPTDSRNASSSTSGTGRWLRM
jgi:hypothetical protein